MAPPRKHGTDAILDATRALVLADGPRAASVAAIAAASGAPAGTLYHRFGSRDGVLTATWLRALERFQGPVLGASGPDALETAVLMAVAAVGFARDLPDDARLLLTIRPGDLLDGDSAEPLTAKIAAMNAPVGERLHTLASALYGSADPRAVDAVYRAVVDLPYAVIRRHTGAAPSWLADDVAAGVRALLISAGRELETALRVTPGRNSGTDPAPE
ncbi:MAG: TetR/AcrR family transcriptional regulator [Mycobacterium sp.]